MAYDPDLANRIRELIGTESDVSEKRMFGGLAFLVAGHMALAAASQGGLLVRIDPDEAQALVASGEASPMEMRGRTMTGWVRVAPERVQSQRALTEWVDRALTLVRSLPPKAGDRGG